MVVSVVCETPAAPESLRGFWVWEEAWSSRSRPGGGAHTHRPARPGRLAPGSNINRIKQRRRRGTTTPVFPCKSGEGSGISNRTKLWLVYRLYRNEARGVIAHDSYFSRASTTARET